MRAFVLSLMCVIAVHAVDGDARSWPIPRTQLAIIAPAAWTAQQDHAGAVLVLRSGLPTTITGDAAERGRGIIAIALQQVKDEPPFAFAVRCRTDLERTATGLKLGVQEPLELGGQQWTKQPYRMQVGQFTFAQELYATVIGGVGICVTCSSSAEAFDQWRPVFDAAITSLGRSRLTIDLK